MQSGTVHADKIICITQEHALGMDCTVQTPVTMMPFRPLSLSNCSRLGSPAQQSQGVCACSRKFEGLLTRSNVSEAHSMVHAAANASHSTGRRPATVQFRSS